MPRFIDVDSDVMNMMWLDLAFNGDAKVVYGDKLFDFYNKVFVDRWGRIHDPHWIPVLEYEADIDRLDTDYDAI